MMKNLIPIIAGITLPVFFTESMQAQSKSPEVLASILQHSQPGVIASGDQSYFFLAQSDKTILQRMDKAFGVCNGYDKPAKKR